MSSIRRCDAHTHAHCHHYRPAARPRTHSRTQRMVEMVAAVKAGAAMGALVGVNGLRVKDKADANLGECLQRHSQPATVAGLNLFDWAYVLGRR